MSFWIGSVPMPFPADEDLKQTEWWEGLGMAMQARWAPLLSRLDAKGRAHFHRIRRGIRDGFKKPEGPEREEEENAAEVALYERVSKGVAKLRIVPTAGQVNPCR